MKCRQFAVIGIGRFGASVAAELYKMGHEVLAIDTREVRIDGIVDRVTHAVVADSTNEAALKSLGITNFDVVIVAIGQDIQASILTTLVLKEMGVRYIVTKALSEQHGKVLQKIGADRIVFPERDMGIRVANNLAATDVIDFIELSPDFSIVECVAAAEMVGKTLREMDLRAKFGVTVLAIRTVDNNINVSPAASDKIQAGDLLIIVGENTNLKKMGRS